MRQLKGTLRNSRLAVILSVLVFNACAGQPATIENEPPSPQPENPDATAMPTGSAEPFNPYAPAKGDEALQRGPLFIDSQEMLVLESFPPQFRLHVKGSLPTPCHELRAVIDNPDEQNRIRVYLYSLVDPNTVCTQVLTPFDISLSLGNYASGTYTVFVNDEETGEISP